MCVWGCVHVGMYVCVGMCARRHVCVWGCVHVGMYVCVGMCARRHVCVYEWWEC